MIAATKHKYTGQKQSKLTPVSQAFEAQYIQSIQYLQNTA